MANHLFFGLDQTAYYPGKPLDGVIILHIQSPIKVKKIGVQCEGNEFVSWFQGVPRNVHCTAKKQIFQESVVVFEEEDGMMFEPGSFAYNFATPLPQNIPLNYEESNKFGGRFGNMFFNDVLENPDDDILPKSLGPEGSFIRYTAMAYADLVGEDHEGNKVEMKLSKICNIKVVEQFDPELLSLPPIEQEIIEKPFIVFGDPVKFKATIANGGNLFAGQNLYVNVNIDNQSNKAVDKIAINLIQIITYTAPDSEGTMQSMKRRVPSLNAILEQGVVNSKGTLDRDVVLPIPSNLPGSIRCGEHIHRSYELQIDVEMVPILTLTIKAPITILEWSPLLKEMMPEVVNINIGRKNPVVEQVEVEEENPLGGSDDGPDLSDSDKED